MNNKPLVDPPERQEWMTDLEWREFLEWDAWCARLNGVEYRFEDAVDDASLYYEQTHLWDGDATVKANPDYLFAGLMALLIGAVAAMVITYLLVLAR